MSQVHVRDPGAGSLWPVAHREDVGERLTLHRLVAGDGGHGGPVTLVGDEAGHPGHLVVRRDLDPAGGGAEAGPGEAEEEEESRPQSGAHGRVGVSRTVGHMEPRSRDKQNTNFRS